MGFTEKKFSSLSKINKIKKIIYALDCSINKKSSENSFYDLILWYNKTEEEKIEIPETEFEIKILKEKLCQVIEDFSDYSINNILDNQKVKTFDNFFVLLDNIRSPYNCGAIIRNSNCFGVSKVILSGITPDLGNSKVKRVSMNSSVEVVKVPDSVDEIKRLKNCGFFVVAIEKTDFSESIETFSPVFPLVLIFGNEEFGLEQDILKLSDKVLHIPNYNKNSFNVAVSSGIVLWEIFKKIDKSNHNLDIN